MIELSVNGTPYTDFLSAMATISLESLANDFSFTSSSVGGFPPFKQGDPVEVLIDGEKVLTGWIDEVAGIEQDGNYKITYAGRDKTGDLIDSQIDIIDDIRADSLTLKGLIEIVIAHIGLNVNVIDNLNPAPFNLAEDFISPVPGESAIGLIMRYARKRQALLTSNGDSDILITQSSPIDNGDVVQSIRGGDTNNIISQTWAVNASNVFNRYIHRGQLDLRALNFSGETDIAAVVNQGAEVTYTGARTSRQRVIVEQNGYSMPQLSERAAWSRQFSIANAIRFTCSLKGHQRPLGGVWRENIVVQVNSTAANINRKMLANTVTFSQGNDMPTITTIEFVEQNVYTTDEKLMNQKKVGDQADAFTSMG